MRKSHHLLLLGIIAVSVFALTGLMTPASAGLQITETSTKRVGATEVRWNSSFQDLDYTLGNTITMMVEWEVLDGAAEYVRFEARHPYFTPKGRDPADGAIVTPAPGSVSDTSVTLEFRFTDLHLDRRRNVEIGNAKFKLYLRIDYDGDGTPEVIVGYGVNVHVEDPQ